MIVAFWHIAQMNHWRDLVTEQAQKLSCLPRVVIGMLGPEEPPTLPSHFEIRHRSDHLSGFEYPTLDLLWEHCQRHNGLVYYCHTKGISHGPNLWELSGDFWKDMGVKSAEHLASNVREWRLYMEHFLIEHREDCWKQLQAYDTCGVSYMTKSKPHYQGNFWWARADYIRTLPKPSEYKRLHGDPEAPRAAAEFWVASGSPRAANLWSSDHNIYLWGMPVTKYAPLFL